MIRVSFRSLSAPRVYPRIATFTLAALLLAGCGGGGGGNKSSPVETVTGKTFRFSAPSGWQTKITSLTASAAPAGGGETLVSVSVFRLVKPYRPELWPKVVPELDRVAAQLASRLHARLAASSTVSVAGASARAYELSFSHQGTDVRERITFVLRSLREYQLLCRWEASASEPPACAQLSRSFRPL